MSDSATKQNFINWCKQLHPNIDADLFIQRYNRYSEEYLPLIENDMTAMHQFIHQENPYANFSFKGRIKSERSFYIKSYVTIAKNIKAIFDNKNDDFERKETFTKFFKFLLKENPEKFDKLQKKSEALIPAFDFRECFQIIFNELSEQEQKKLVARLGRTEDTFAYRVIVNSVDFPIKSIESSSASKFYIIDKDGNKLPINGAVRINPKKDIIHSEEDNEDYVLIDGVKEILNERNLLYPSDLPSNQRTFENAQKDENGNLTLLRDSFIGKDNSSLDIIDIKINPNNHAIYVTDSNDEVRNITALLNQNNLKLRKHDEDSLIKEVYHIDTAIQDYYQNHDIQSIKNRRKDYIANPKPTTQYKSIHDSAINNQYGYAQEGQNRTLKMEDVGKDETTRIGHDIYKKKKTKEFSENEILAEILEKEPNAFDSSTPVLMELLEKGIVELPEVLGKYVLTTSMADDISQSFVIPIDVIFFHTFHRADPLAISSDDSLPKLDFSSYANFIASKRNRTLAMQDEPNIPDIY